MGKKPKKSLKKFAAKGLAKEIEARKRHQLIARKRRNPRAGKGGGDEDDEVEVVKQDRGNAQAPSRNNAGKASANGAATGTGRKIEDLSIDEFLEGDFLEDLGSDDEDEAAASSSDEEGAELRTGSGDDDEGMPDAQRAAASSSDSEDEEEGGLSQQNKRLKTEVAQHKQELEALRKKDPEFFKYLEEHDKELLDFANDSDEEPEAATTEEAGPSADVKKAVVTTAMVEAWGKAAKETHAFGATKNLLRAFRAACHYGETSNDNADIDLTIAGSNVFNKIMWLVFGDIDNIFRGMLSDAQQQGTDKKSKKQASVGPLSFRPQDSSRWKKIEPLVKSYLGNALHLLGQMSDSKMIGFAVMKLKQSIPFLGPLPKFARKYLKAILRLWSTDNTMLRYQACYFIEQMATQLPDSLDTCLKGVYRAFSSNAKFVNATSRPAIDLLSLFTVRLYMVDLAVSYQHAFSFIRQLAIMLRNALTQKTKDAYKNVYCWQYINCCELWVKVLEAAAPRQVLQPLVYPLAQIITGVIRLVPTPRYFPLRLRCVSLLNKLSAFSHQFIPVAPHLLEVLQSSDLSKPPTGTASPSLDLNMTLKVTKQAVRAKSFQDLCVAEALLLSAEHFSQWALHISFPELALAPLVQLRKLAKDLPVERFRKQVKQLVDGMEANIVFVGQRRDAVDFSPKDAAAIANFMSDKAPADSPLVRYTNTLLEKAVQLRQQARAGEVVLREGKRKPHADSEEDVDDEPTAEAAFSGNWLPSGKPAARPEARGEDDEDESSEEEKQQKQQKKKGTEGKDAMRAELPAETDEMLPDDELEELVLSDDEDLVQSLDGGDDDVGDDDDGDDDGEDNRPRPSPVKGGRGKAARGKHANKAQNNLHKVKGGIQKKTRKQSFAKNKQRTKH